MMFQSPRSCFLVVVMCAMACTSPSQIAHQDRPVPFTGVKYDTIPSTDRIAVWEAVLGFYRSGRISTEADRAGRAHGMLGIDSQRVSAGRAPVVLHTVRRPWPMFASKRLAPYDSVWLEQLRTRHLVSGLCAEEELKSCPDTVPTTYLSLDDPRWGPAGAVIVEVTESALDPAACRTSRTIFDFQEVTLAVGKRADVWLVERVERGGHGFGWCPS